MAITVVVIVEGGIVQQVECTDKDVIVRVIDMDEEPEGPYYDATFVTSSNGGDDDDFVNEAIQRYLA
jgi:hypothetical protein